MRRTLGLVAVWLTFVVTAVAVGFGAAGLIDEPIAAAGAPRAQPLAASTPQVTSESTSPPGSGTTTDRPRAATPRSVDGSATGTSSGEGSASPRSGSAIPRSTPGTAASGSPQATPARPSATTPRSTASRPRSPSPSPSPSSTSSSSSTSVTRGINTEGGYVGATCSNGLVKMSASPNPGWVVKDLSEPGRVEGRVEFEQPDPGEGEVKVDATCVNGAPRFTVQAENADREDQTPSTGRG